MRIGILSEKYEGGGVSTISTGNGDSGGVSYLIVPVLQSFPVLP